MSEQDLLKKRKYQYTAPQDLLDQEMKGGQSEEPMPGKSKKISDREDSYQQRKYLKELSPERSDPFRDGDKTPDINKRNYSSIMMEQKFKNKQVEEERKIQKQNEELQMRKLQQFFIYYRLQKESKQRDQKIAQKMAQQASENSESGQSTTIQKSDWEHESSGKVVQSYKLGDTPGRNLNTPGRMNRWDMTPVGQEKPTPGRNKFGETPTPGRTNQLSAETPHMNKFGETPTPRRGLKSRWDDKTPIGGTPGGGFGGMTPTPGGMTPSMAGMTPERLRMLRWEKEVQDRNRPLTDEELNQILPSNGYEIIMPPASYNAIRKHHEKLQGTPVQGTPAYYNLPIQGIIQRFQEYGKPYEIPGTPKEGPNALPSIKPEDLGYFGALLNPETDQELSLEDQKNRKIMMLLLKIKNGTPPMRKSALRQITINAKELGPGPLFNQILPLLMSPTLEDQERHLLVKVIDRILYKLDDLVRPYVHKILVVIEPLLIDEDYYARVEGREIISNLAKAAGLATMISTMRPDIDHSDEYVRNTTARAFAVVASALGIPSLLPFLRAVCQSKKSWQARHTGIKIIQQIAILMGCAVLPHLKKMVEIVEGGLRDEQQKVRTITALSIAALAEAATPYGIEAFESVLIPLWDGINMHRSKGLAAFLKAIGYIIPLMDTDHAGDYTKEVMHILIKEFQNPEEEMKKIVLKVVKQCVSCSGVDSKYVKDTILQEFFRNFWIRRMALDKRNYKQLVDTTVEIAQKVGGAQIIQRIVEDLKDENEAYRKMVMETIEKIVATLGVADIGSRLEIQLMDGIIRAFQEQSTDDTLVILNGFGTIINNLGMRAKPYFAQICAYIVHRLANKSARVRQQAADLVSRIAMSMLKCGEEQKLGKLGVSLYESLGEEYPEVLGSMLGGLKAIVNVIGMQKMTPPIKDLLPRLTPILKNRHEKVQENCIDLVGRIADRGSEYVSPKEWMRICFDLLDLLKAHKKGIRRATVNTFGYIAKAIGPQDVLVTLLNNLKVQERQNRVCTTVAIAIVAETCGPVILQIINLISQFTVLPALMNEYRAQEMNVQNGVLKSLSFMFEYVGEMSKDYIYAITPLLEDALMDRDLVHRQTASAAVKHLALGVQGLNCEDALTHLMNFVWPNVFEVSPHVINAVTEAVEGMRVSIGAGAVLMYVLQGLFHPARRIREIYWKFYNILYVGSQESLVAFKPLLENLDVHRGNPQINKYINHEMYGII